MLEVFLSEDEILELYSTKKETLTRIPDFYSKPKIILTIKAGNKPSFVYPKYFSKQIGVTNNTMYKIISPNEKNKYLNFFDSKLIKFIMKITQYSESPNHMNEHKIINLLDKDKFDKLSNNPDDAEIYSKFGIKDSKLIKLIEEIVDDKKETKKSIKTKKNNLPPKNNITKINYGKPPSFSNSPGGTAGIKTRRKKKPSKKTKKKTPNNKN